MDKSETEEALRQDTEWKTRDTGSIWTRHKMDKPVTSSIEIGHIMDKPETQAALTKDREWTNQRHTQY
jgi:hypothetical protein